MTTIQVLATDDKGLATITAEVTLERRGDECGMVYGGTFFGFDLETDYADDDWEVWHWFDFFVADDSERAKCRAFMAEVRA